MKDWENLIADEDRIIGTHYTPGRAGHKIDKVVIHHNAGVLSIADCYNTWQTRPASAHYQVETGGRIGQLVHDADTAWHAANLLANQTSIGVEHANSGGAAQDWPISGETIDAGAHLVAAICRYYGLGRPQWMVNVFPHKHFGQTACPYHLADTYLNTYMAKAQAWYDSMTKGTAAPTATVDAKTPTDRQGLLTVDGVPGPATQARLEQVMGVTINGVDEPHEPAFEKLQAFLNTVVSKTDIKNLTGKDALDVDGVAGPATWKVLQYWIWNVRHDLVKAFMPSADTMPDWVDGIPGAATWKALQTCLNGSWAGSGKLLAK